MGPEGRAREEEEKEEKQEEGEAEAFPESGMWDLNGASQGWGT